MKTVKATTEAVVCALDTRKLRERMAELRPRMLSQLRSVSETDEGFALEFVPAAIDLVREFVAFESGCCSFMTYSIDDGDADRIMLGISGPEGTKEFVRAWLSGRVEVIDGSAR